MDKTTRRSIDVVLADAQARLRRLSAVDALAAVFEGWTLVEWRVDPASERHSAEFTGREDRLSLICRDGYSSSLAAVRLHELGFTETTDVIGGFGAWLAAGLPVER